MVSMPLTSSWKGRRYPLVTSVRMNWEGLEKGAHRKEWAQRGPWWTEKVLQKHVTDSSEKEWLLQGKKKGCHVSGSGCSCRWSSPYYSWFWGLKMRLLRIHRIKCLEVKPVLFWNQQMSKLSWIQIISKSGSLWWTPTNLSTKGACTFPDTIFTLAESCKFRSSYLSYRD